MATPKTQIMYDTENYQTIPENQPMPTPEEIKLAKYQDLPADWKPVIDSYETAKIQIPYAQPNVNQTAENNMAVVQPLTQPKGFMPSIGVSKSEAGDLEFQADMKERLAQSQNQEAEDLLYNSMDNKQDKINDARLGVSTSDNSNPYGLTDLNTKSLDKLYDENFKELQKLIGKSEKLANSPISSAEVMKDTPVWAKVLGAIGLVLSSATPETSRAASSAILGAIDREMSAQKNNALIQAQKNGLLQKNYEQILGNINDQRNFFIQKAKLMIDDKANAVAANNKNASARLKTLGLDLDKYIGLLNTQSKINRGESERLYSKSAATSSKPVDAAMMAKLPEEARQRALVGFSGLAKDKASAKIVADDHASFSKAFSELERLRGLRGEGGKWVTSRIPLTEGKREVSQIENRLMGLLRLEVTGPGVLTPSDKDMIKGYIGGLGSATTPAQVDKLLDNIESTVINSMKTNSGQFGFTGIPSQYDAIEAKIAKRNK